MSDQAETLRSLMRQRKDSAENFGDSEENVNPMTIESTKKINLVHGKSKMKRKILLDLDLREARFTDEPEVKA